MPQLEVGCIRVTHPCAGRRHVLLHPLPLDLHVLGLPLAFILSQDQTLRCRKSLILTKIVIHQELTITYLVSSFSFFQRTVFFLNWTAKLRTLFLITKYFLNFFPTFFQTFFEPVFVLKMDCKDISFFLIVQIFLHFFENFFSQFF